MCRLYGFIANEPTKVDCSLVFAQNALMQQSRVDSDGRDHADGWGIATYEQGRPAVQKKTTAAHSDRMFSTVAERIYSRVIVAHIRAATVGPTSLANTHPFISGQWTFAHNGTVSGFDQLADQLARETAGDLQQQRSGDTDSEQYFLWLLSRLRDREITQLTGQASAEIVDLLTSSAGELAERCRKVAPDETPRLNFILTDGQGMVACRWNHSLHLVERQGLADCEICGIPHVHHHETTNHQAVAIASEPVTHEPWRELENQCVIMVDPGFALNSVCHSR